MMVGEPQILGQIKDAYHDATQKKATGVILNRLLHKSFFVAKRVRSETGIGDHAVSISYAAIELGRKIFGSLDGRSVLLVGAGEMAELAVEHLLRNRIGQVWVANRTFARGMELAGRFGGKAIRFEEIAEHLKTVDVIISSTGAPGYVITSDLVKQSMRLRRNRPLFFIDIAVPRDIDPEINQLPNSFVYDIDDLKGVIEENIEDRRKEAVKGERIVDEAVLSFRQWLESLEVVPTIVGLRSKLEAIAQSELQKTTQSLTHLSEEDARAISRMTCAMINKILHDPILFLKQNGATEDGAACLNLVRKLFKLDP
jgi:glutamyl-tRNA reductase